MQNGGRLSLAVAGCAALLFSGTATAAVLQWVPGDSGAAKGNALIGGQEPGRQLPICRGAFNGGMHPGKVVAGNCNIGWGGKEILLTRFEVLTGPANAVQWVRTATGTKLPPEAFVGGQEPGRLLPICRGAYNSGVHPGKIVAGKCNIGWGGREIELTAYETMTLTPATLGTATPVTPAAAGAVAVQKDKEKVAEILALLAALRAERGAPSLEAVKEHAMKVHKMQDQMKWAAEALKALNAGKTAKDQTGAGLTVEKAAETAGVRLTGKADADKVALKALLDKLNKESQTDLAKIQNMTDQRNQQFQLISDIVKKFAAQRQAIVQNMR